MKLQQLFSILAAGALIQTATGADFQIDKSQYEARHKAGIRWEDKDLILRSNTPEWDAGLRINPVKGKLLDLSQGKYLTVDVENLSDRNQMRLTMHITSGSRKEKNFREAYTGVGLNPGEKRSIRMYLPHASVFAVDKEAHGMRTLDTAKINSIEFKMQWPFEPEKKDLLNCRLSNLRLEGKPEYEKKIPADKYLPFIDVYGQYNHGNWPEKIRKDEDLKNAHAKELAELSKTRAPAEWNRFGGWKNGPQLKATGNFRTEKYQGKWFLVDPEGRLFWSTGIDVLRTHTDATNGKKHPKWFSRELPPDGILPFTHWNLQKKYGKQNYQDDFFRVLGKRMTAWGINTIGNWGAKEFMAMGEKPYTVSLCDFDKSFPAIGDSKVKFYDVYDPRFEEKMGNVLKDRAEADPFFKKTLTDPMCIGYFIDNELKFDRIMPEIIKASESQPAKQAFVKDLKVHYKDSIADLNQSWKTEFKTWDDLLKNTKEPTAEGYKKDRNEFYKKFVNRYFEICRKGIKSIAPHRLYLGCRFIGFRQPAVIWDATAKNCDVLSVNSYSNSIANCNPKDFRDKPLLVGEFHFGTLDRGMFSASLCPQATQQDRAVSYTRYVQGALVHPNIVGAHYFQFRDQPLTGRYDGEGYQIGFVDVADTPYPEMGKAAREIGENMYQYRLQGKLNNSMK